MSQISPILRDVQGGGLSFWCPGCKYAHTVWIGSGAGERWGWNGSLLAPTFSPSILVRTIKGEGLTDADWEEYDRIARGPGGTEAVLNHPKFRFVCHSFVNEGQIQFLGDCSHALAGQTVPLPSWPERKTTTEG
jgi:hypothetical protein